MYWALQRDHAVLGDDLHVMRIRRKRLVCDKRLPNLLGEHAVRSCLRLLLCGVAVGLIRPRIIRGTRRRGLILAEGSRWQGRQACEPQASVQWNFQNIACEQSHVVTSVVL